MRNHSFFLLLFFVLTGFLLGSCQDEGVPLPEKSTVEFSEESAVIAAKGRYYTVIVRTKDTTLSIHCEAEWIVLSEKHLPKDGALEFYVEKNREEKGRDAFIELRSGVDPTFAVNFTVHQYGTADIEENGLGEGAELTRDFRVGWGYNIFQEFMNERSITKPVLDYNKLLAAEGKMDNLIIQEDNRRHEEFDTYSAYTLQEMSRMLTQVQEKESSFLGLKKTVSRFKLTTTTYSLDAQNYGYARFSKIVASRYLDMGILEYLVGKGENIFSEEFMTIHKEVMSNPTDATIDKMLNLFGTHIVVSADIGGMIDYTVNFSKQDVTELSKSVETRARYVLGVEKSSEKEEHLEQYITSITNSDLALTVMGGSEATVSDIKNEVGNLNRHGQLQSSTIDKWLKSLDGDYKTDPGYRNNLAVVGCRTVPIWSMFNDASVRGRIVTRVSEMANRSDCQFSREEIGINNYLIRITEDMTYFPDSPDETLVKVLYLYKEPIVEVCNEYVPAIRSDRRITLLYPIVGGCPNIRQGLFPGDGQGNPPAYVTFSDGDVYVKPIEGKKPDEILDQIYYINGNLYEDDFGTQTGPAMQSDLRKEYLTLSYEGVTSYPIVKIGSGYWTRTNMTMRMYFGEPVDPSDEYSEYYEFEEMFNGILYANFYYGNFPGFTEANETVYGNRNLWYLPKVADMKNLQIYLGQNLKALFKKQQSGFEAEFAGYYGRYDDLNNGTDWKEYQLRYQNEYCFIPFRDNSITGTALILSPDYTLKSITVKGAQENYYPIRLFRTSGFVYSKI